MLLPKSLLTQGRQASGRPMQAVVHCPQGQCLAGVCDWMLTARAVSSGCRHAAQRLFGLLVQGAVGTGAPLEGLQRTAAATVRDLLELHAALAQQHPGIRWPSCTALAGSLHGRPGSAASTLLLLVACQHDVGC